MTLRSHVLCAVVLLPMLAACSADVDSEGGETAAPKAETESKLLARLELSDTHVIEFRQGPFGVLSLTEDRHMELDIAQPSYDKLGQTELRLAPAYEYLAGDLADPQELALLREVDAQHEARLRAAGVDDSTQVEVAEAPPAPDGIEIPPEGGVTMKNHFPTQVEVAEAPPAPDGIEIPPEGGVTVKNHFPTNTCTPIPPGFTWTDNNNFWRANLCDSQSLDCRMSMSWASFGWWRTNNYTGAGIEQDLCNVGRLKVEVQVHQPPLIPCFGNGGIVQSVIANIAINPQHSITFASTNNGGGGTCDVKVYYNTLVEKLSGPNGSRVGIVVNPKPFGPCRRGCSLSSSGTCLCPI